MPQHTSSEVTVGYNTKKFKCLRERLEPNQDNCEKLIICRPILSLLENIYFQMIT